MVVKKLLYSQPKVLKVEGMKYLIVLSVLLMIISTSLELSAGAGVAVGDSYSNKEQPSIKVQRNTDYKKQKPHIVFQDFLFHLLFSSLLAFSLTFSIYPRNINLFNVNDIDATKRCEIYLNLTIKTSEADPECLQYLRRSCLW